MGGQARRWLVDGGLSAPRPQSTHPAHAPLSTLGHTPLSTPPGAVVDMEDMGAMMSKQREDPNTGGKGGSARNNRRYPGEVAVGGTLPSYHP